MDRLSLDEIKVGMKVDPKQLKGIIGVAILLSNYNNEPLSTIEYIGSPYTDEAISINKKTLENGGSFCTIYEPYDNEEVSWDE